MFSLGCCRCPVCVCWNCCCINVVSGDGVLWINPSPIKSFSFCEGKLVLFFTPIIFFLALTFSPFLFPVSIINTAGIYSWSEMTRTKCCGVLERTFVTPRVSVAAFVVASTFSGCCYWFYSCCCNSCYGCIQLLKLLSVVLLVSWQLTKNLFSAFLLIRVEPLLNQQRIHIKAPTSRWFVF